MQDYAGKNVYYVRGSFLMQAISSSRMDSRRSNHFEQTAVRHERRNTTFGSQASGFWLLAFSFWALEPEEEGDSANQHILRHTTRNSIYSALFLVEFTITRWSTFTKGKMVVVGKANRPIKSRTDRAIGFSDRSQ